VRYVLEGSVRKAGDRVRVTAQLIDGESGHHLWAERFDRTLEDVFDVQDEVTRRIVASLAGKVGESERRRARSGRSADRTAHPEAYDLVLQGRELWFKFTDEKNRKARSLYEKAIALDPEYARAYASLAWTYLVEYESRWGDDPHAAYAKALELARKGVSVNPASHSNHLTLGQVYLWHGEHAMAIEALKTGIRLNPNDLDGYAFMARAMAFDGRHDIAVEKITTAIDIASNVPEWYYWVQGMTLTMARRYDEAVAAIDRMKDPGHNALRWRVVCRHHQGQDEEARQTMAQILRLKPDFSLARHMETMPFRLAEDRAHYEDALKAAGAPA
jgi:tetratricopeptide (TPR) repeat protein